MPLGEAARRERDRDCGDQRGQHGYQREESLGPIEGGAQLRQGFSGVRRAPDPEVASPERDLRARVTQTSTGGGTGQGVVRSVWYV